MTHFISKRHLKIFAYSVRICSTIKRTDLAVQIKKTRIRIMCAPRSGVFKLFKTRPSFIMQTKLAPPLMIAYQQSSSPIIIKKPNSIEQKKIAKICL